MTDLASRLRQNAEILNELRRDFVGLGVPSAEGFSRVASTCIEAATALEILQKPSATSVPMPQNADQAAAMWLIGERWIRDNAPERLRPAQNQGES